MVIKTLTLSLNMQDIWSYFFYLTKTFIRADKNCGKFSKRPTTTYQLQDSIPKRMQFQMQI